ncbi:MAG: hypothetical protein OEY10_00005, partial [Nitrosopumilus sp.]|nr:hypothetical protein [Nitrosopumilus sp.]
MDKKELESVLKGAMEETVEVLGKKQADAIAAVKDEVNKKLEDINKTVNEKNINTDKTTIEVKEPEPEFVKDAGQFFTMVAKAANDVKVKVDFAEALEKNWKIKAPSGSNTLVSSEGGFLLTPQIAAEIKSAMYETGQLYKAADIMPL